MLHQKIIKVFSLALLMLLFTFQSHGQLARGVRMIEVLASESNVLNLLMRNGIDQIPAQNIRDSVALSWRSLAGSQELPNATQLQSMIRTLDINDPSDMRIRMELEGLLERPVEQVSQQDIVTAINHLIYLASRHGQSEVMAMACSACLSNGLTRHGFRYTLRSVQNASAQEVISNILPTNPSALRSYISTRMRAMGLGDYSRVPVNLVSPEEERALGLFLGIAEHGSAKQRELANAIIDVSRTPDGEVVLLNPRNPHKLWKLFADDIDEAAIENWTVMLRQVAEDAQDEVSKKEAFFAYLNRQVGDDVVGQEHVNMMRAQRCFFK